MRYELGLVFVTYNKTVQNLFVITRPEGQEYINKKLSLFKTIFQKIIFFDTVPFEPKSLNTWYYRSLGESP